MSIPIDVPEKRPARTYPDSRDDSETARSSGSGKLTMLVLAGTVLGLAYWVNSLNSRLDDLQARATLGQSARR